MRKINIHHKSRQYGSNLYWDHPICGYEYEVRCIMADRNCNTLCPACVLKDGHVELQCLDQPAVLPIREEYYVKGDDQVIKCTATNRPEWV